MAASLGDLIIRVGANIEEFQGAMAAVSSRVGDVASEVESKFAGFDKIGRQLTGIGTTLTAGLTVPIAGIGIEAVTSAASFELAMRKVSSLIDNVTEPQFKALYNQTLEMSRALGVDAVKAADGLYQAISTGIPPDNAVSFLKTASVAAIAGLTDTRVAVDGITTVIQAFGLKATEAGQVADAMFMAVNKGKLEFPELAASIGIAAGSAHILGVSYQELLAAGATITIATGQKIPEAMTQLQSAMKSLLKPTKQMSDLITETGYASGEALVKAKGLEGAIQAVSAAANGNATALIAAYGRIEGFRGALALTGGNAAVAKEHLDAMNNSAGAATRAFDEIDKSTARQWQRLTTDLKDTAIALGTSLLPAVNSVLAGFKPLAELVQNAVTWFAGLPEPIRTTTLVLAGMAGAAGPLLLVLGGMSMGVGSLMSGLTLLTGAFTAVAPIIAAFATVTIPGAIAAVIEFATVSIPAGILAIGGFATALLVDAGAAIVAFAGAITTDAVAALTTLAVTSLPTTISAVMGFATTAIPAAIGAITTLATTAIPAAISGFQMLVVTTIPNVITALGTLATGAIPVVVGALSTISVAALAVGAAFVGWKIGELALSHIPALQRLNDAIGDIVVKIPLVGDAIMRWSGISAIGNQANTDFAASTEKLRTYLVAHGVAIDRGALSLDDYNKKLIAAAQGLVGQAGAVKTATAAVTDHTKSQSELNAELKKAQKNLTDTQRLFKEGAASVDDVRAALQRVQIASAAAHPELHSTGLATTALAKAAEDYNTKSIKFTAAQITEAQKTADLRKELDEAERQFGTLIQTMSRGEGPLQDLEHALDNVKMSVTRMYPELGTLNTVIGQMATPTNQATAAANAYGDALATLHIKSSGELRATADETRTAYGTIKDSSIATQGEVEQAWARMTQAEIDYRRSLGEDVGPLEIELAKYKDAHKSAASDVKSQWTNLTGDIARNIHGAIEEIFTGKFGLQSLLDMFTKIGADIVSVMLKPAEEAIAKFIVNALKPLMDGFGDILSNIPLIGGALGKVFGPVAPVGTSIKTPPFIPGGEEAGIPAAGQAAGTAGSAAGSTGSLLSSFASAASIVSAVTGIASGIVAGFQAAHEIDLLKLIEANTRFAWIVLGQGTESIFWFTKSLGTDFKSFFMEYLYSWYHDAWAELLDGVGKLVEMGGGAQSSQESAPPDSTEQAMPIWNAMRDSLNSIDSYAQGIYLRIQDDLDTRLDAVLAALSGGLAVTATTPEGAPVQPAVPTTAPLMTFDAAAQFSTMNNTLSGISMILQRGLGTLAPSALGPIEVGSSSLMEALNRGANAVADAVRTATITITQATLGGSQAVVAALAGGGAGGGVTVVNHFHGNVAGDRAVDEMADKITNRLRNVIRR